MKTEPKKRKKSSALGLQQGRTFLMTVLLLFFINFGCKLNSPKDVTNGPVEVAVPPPADGIEDDAGQPGEEVGIENPEEAEEFPEETGSAPPPPPAPPPRTSTPQPMPQAAPEVIEVVEDEEVVEETVIESTEASEEEVVIVAREEEMVAAAPASVSFQSVPMFPWPPPKPSAKVEIPASAFSECQVLQQVNRVLTAALADNEYDDKSYFLVPSTSNSGFAIATQLEQIKRNASSVPPPNRWNINTIDNSFRFAEYVSSLFFSNPGYFRVIVFVVTDTGFIPSERTTDRATALSWVDSGFDRFPPNLAGVPFTENHKVTALVYEYRVPENSDQAELTKPSRHSGMRHLKKANLWSNLVNNSP